MIDKIGQIGKILNPSQKGKVEKTAPQINKGDSVSISAEAQKAAELAGHIKTVKNSSDPDRAEKLKEVKAKLANGDYDNPSAEMLDSIADRISPTLLQ